jgi:hypothetical protein
VREGTGLLVWQVVVGTDGVCVCVCVVCVCVWVCVCVVVWCVCVCGGVGFVFFINNQHVPL